MVEFYNRDININTVRIETQSTYETKKCIITFTLYAGDFNLEIDTVNENYYKGYSSNYTLQLHANQRVYEFDIIKPAAIIAFVITKGKLYNSARFSYIYYLIPQSLPNYLTFYPGMELNIPSIFLDSFNKDNIENKYYPSDDTLRMITFYPLNCEIEVTLPLKGNIPAVVAPDGKLNHVVPLMANVLYNFSQNFTLTIKNPERYDKLPCLVSIASMSTDGNMKPNEIMNSIPFELFMNKTVYGGISYNYSVKVFYPTINEELKYMVMRVKLKTQGIFERVYGLILTETINVAFLVNNITNYDSPFYYLQFYSNGVLVELTFYEDIETPRYLAKNDYYTLLGTQNTRNYYIFEIEPDEECEIQLAFLCSLGNVYAKLYNKLEVEEEANWAGKYILPNSTTDNLLFDKESQKLTVSSNDMDKCAINGCDLIIGVEIPYLLPDYEEYRPKMEYDIFFRSKNSLVEIYIYKFVKEHLDFSKVNEISHSYLLKTGNSTTRWLEFQIHTSIPLKVSINNEITIEDKNFSKGSTLWRFYDKIKSNTSITETNFIITITALNDNNTNTKGKYSFVIIEGLFQDFIPVYPGNPYLCKIEDTNGGSCYFDFK